MLIVQGTIPAPASSDVTTRVITIAVTTPGGVSIDPFTIEKNVVDTTFTFTVAPGSTVVATLVDKDAAGNQSPPSVSAPFVAVDIFPPSQPGAISFQTIGEETPVNPDPQPGDNPLPL